MKSKRTQPPLVAVTYLRAVRRPLLQAGQVGQTRELPAFAARKLIEGGYAKAADADESPSRKPRKLPETEPETHD